MLARKGFSLLVAVALFAIALTHASPGAAKSNHESHYNYQQTFGTALRLVKVDLDLQVTETNGEWGYFLFVYTSRESGKRKNRGSFSFVRRGQQVHVVLQIPQMPSYHERVIMQKLTRKLAEEHGAPPEAKDEPVDDEDDDDSAEDDNAKKDEGKDKPKATKRKKRKPYRGKPRRRR
ncbi:MAG: hypothetical protein DRI90_21555 [Deltaproteobacteria bacterium]|nr:MAG: hypothetical protein DRI90_21555 [Deltaproteobacteria bacterium]